MPIGGSITGYLFADFTFTNDGGAINPSQNGPFTLPSDAQGTLAIGASPVDINVLDDDDEFDDGFQDDPVSVGLNQTLRDDINATDATGNPVTVTAGAVLEVEFTLTATPVGGGTPIDLLFVAAGPGENQGDIILVVSTETLDPNTLYDIVFKNDGGGTQYGELVCFVRGTLIRTPNGDIPVEQLAVGDRIMTLDIGMQSITWVAKRTVLFPRGDDRPIWVAQDTFGPAQPYAETGFSPRHCLFRRDEYYQMMFDSSEVLMAAGDCADGTNIVQDTTNKPVEYFHFMLETHGLVWANGMLTESFYPGLVARQSLDPMAHARLVALYPELADPAAPAPFPRVRPRLRGYELQSVAPDVAIKDAPAA